MARRKEEIPREVEDQLPEELRIEALRAHPERPSKERHGAGPGYLKLIRDRRRALAKVDERYGGGRPKSRFTRAEAEEAALEAMLPQAVKVLREQLDNPDQKVRQSAAIKVIEYAKGKPTQTIQADMHQVTRIVYESAAWRPELEVIEGEAIDVSPLELDPIDAA